VFVVAGESDRRASKEAMVIRPSRASRGEHESFVRDLLDCNWRSSENETCGKAVDKSRQSEGWYFASTVSLRGFLKQTVPNERARSRKVRGDGTAPEKTQPKGLRSLFENASMFGTAYISTARI
jgi:hypothetical protein